ncbi:hypothetical protein ACKF11_11560 [Methylobacillus sp. Pita2]|uniref:hypothetical protein n=1 Tax=Methylobacillus sp. Pita2 TaxID=3383245 RepID=UPI0038B67BDE
MNALVQIENNIATPPALERGEIWVGTIVSANKRYQIVRLPGDSAPANYKKQLDWASKCGGVIPNLIEFLLIRQEIGNQSLNQSYWTSDARPLRKGYAFCCCVRNGLQEFCTLNSKLRAIAIRRVYF